MDNAQTIKKGLLPNPTPAQLVVLSDLICTILKYRKCCPNFIKMIEGIKKALGTQIKQTNSEKDNHTLCESNFKHLVKPVSRTKIVLMIIIIQHDNT